MNDLESSNPGNGRCCDVLFAERERKWFGEVLFVCIFLGSAVLPESVAAQPPSYSARPGRVEPTHRATFGPGRETPAGTVFHLKILKKAENASIRLQICGIPCTTAFSVKVWEPAAYGVGDELSWRVEEAGDYYLWSQNLGNDKVSVIVSDMVVDQKLLLTFDSGAVLEAWYVNPRVPPKQKPTTR